MKFSELWDLLKTPLKIGEVELCAGPFVKLKFSAQDIMGLREAHREVEEILALFFLERRVMWMDLSKEVPEFAQKSLEELGQGLHAHATRFSTASNQQVFYHLATQWAIEATVTGKELRDKLQWIRNDKDSDPGGYSDSHADMQDACADCARTLRARVYPIVDALIQALPNDSSIGARARVQWGQSAGILMPTDAVPALVADWKPSVS